MKMSAIVKRLEKAFGPPDPPFVTEPFAVIVWENCAYLVDDERRRRVYSELDQRVGVEPSALLSAPEEVLRDVLAPGGMNVEARVEKVRRCAELAEEIGLEALEASVRERSPKAKKLLKRFPGVGDPLAEKILLLAGATTSLAPDSNALRVLLRLGFGEESKDYGKSYRSGVDAAARELPKAAKALVAASAVLRRHGQDVCQRSAPRCDACPVSDDCKDFARRS